jgi:hypothetical protein
MVRWAGIALAIAGFALFGWLRWRGESESFIFARATSFAPASEPSFLTKPIRDIEVIQDRVLAHHPAAEPSITTLGPVDPATWRVVHLEADKTDGNSIEILLARPLSWLEEHRAETGASIALDLPEFGVSGRARVTLVAPCPAVPNGDGELVTGKFIHRSGELLDLYVEGNDEPLGVTLNHRIWSADRQQFVPAQELQAGEHLLNARGDESPILHVERRIGCEPVYNLEVDGQHVYFVSRAGLLVHNACGPGKWIDDNYGTRPSKSYQAQVTGKPKKQYQVGKVKFDGYKGGKLVEAKGVGYKNLLNGSKKGKEVAKEVKSKLLKQARRQVAEAAKHGKPVKWVFAEKEAAEMMRKSLEKLGIEVTTKKMDWGKMID